LHLLMLYSQCDVGAWLIDTGMELSQGALSEKVIDAITAVELHPSATI
jgi:hypothetical protein